MRRSVLIVGVAGLIAGSLSCKELTAPEPVASIALSESAIELVPEETAPIVAATRRADGVDLRRRVVWASSETGVATVSNGIVTARSPGLSVITATSESITARVDVVVADGGVINPRGASISGLSGAVHLTVPSSAVSSNAKIVIRRVAFPLPHRRLLAGSAIEIRSSAGSLSIPAKLSVRYDATKLEGSAAGLRLFGLVNGDWSPLAASGSDTVAQRVSGDVPTGGVFAIFVQAPVAKLTISGPTACVRVREQLSYSASVFDDAANELKGRPIVWNSSNTQVLSVDANTGSANAKSPGPVEVSAQSEGIRSAVASCVVAGLPARISRVAGDNQTANAGQSLPLKPSVRIADQDGFAIEGATVRFSVRDGGGRIDREIAISNVEGIAEAGVWTLGGSAGLNTLDAAVEGIGAPQLFSATAIKPESPTPVATSISIVAGDGQLAQTRKAVATSPAVRVLDQFARPLPGAIVVFAVSTGGGTITGARTATNESGIATAGVWTLGSVGENSLSASVEGRTISPAIFSARAEPVASGQFRVVTFGDSNTDAGYPGTNPDFAALSYVSSDRRRSSANAPNHSTQLAGKIESKWRAQGIRAITVVNHGISGTRSDAGRTEYSAPNARENIGGVTRFEAEVLGRGYPWSGRESGVEYPAGAITRVHAFRPGPDDFAYISIGTNDYTGGLGAAESAANIGWMIDTWIADGHAADHLIVTTLAPRQFSNGAIPPLNSRIRGICEARGVKLIDLAARTSSDDGATWKSASDHIGDSIHYSEVVREWLADQVVSYMLAKAGR